MAVQTFVDADLTFSAVVPGAGRGEQRIAGTLTGTGQQLAVRLDALPSLRTVTRNRAALRVVGERLAAAGLQVAVHGPDGVLATLGAVRPSLLARIGLRSRHVRLGPWSRVLGAWRGPGTVPLALEDLLPATTPLPPAPTFGRLPRRITTTHDPYGGGSPRLYFPSGANPLPPQTHVFYLKLGGVTTVGSDPRSALQLAGLDPQQAEIRRDEHDEYVLHARGTTPCRVNGAPVSKARLRTGTRIEIGPWTMVYFRAEYADHGRPYGGRIGGEAGHQRPQERPEFRRPGGL